VSWSPDGSLIATSLSKTVYVYSASGEEVWRTSDHQSTVSTIAWTNKGELATACYGQVQFLDGVSGNLIQKLEWKGSLVSIALSSDSDIVACGSQDNSVHFWRRSSGNDSKMSGYPFKPSALSFNNKGTLVATGGSEAATVWNFEGDGPEGTSPVELDYHADAITSLLFSNHSNRLLSGCRNGTVVLWEISTNNVVSVSEKLLQLGCYEVAISDTNGVGTPEQTKLIIEELSESLPIDKIAMHMHDTRGRAIENIQLALSYGISSIDASVAGLGGCPYAPVYSGNVATEDVVNLLNDLGIEHGINLQKLISTGNLISKILKRKNSANILRQAKAPFQELLPIDYDNTDA